MKRSILRLMGIVTLLIAGNYQNAHALLSPRPIATDSRIQTVMYSPNEVYRFVGHYGYQSSIEFAPDEEIQTISLGDSMAWQITPSGNRMFLKPVEQDALTNMTVITNKRTYLFELHPEEAESIQDKSMVFVLRFVYGDEGFGGGLNNYIDPVPQPEIDEHPEKYNFNYSISGSDIIAPIRIFDDGEFTYFEFKDKNAEVPAFFNVDSQGNESLINFRTRGDYIVVERVSSQFTLRHGADVTCVYNESMPLAKSKK